MAAVRVKISRNLLFTAMNVHSILAICPFGNLKKLMILEIKNILG